MSASDAKPAEGMNAAAVSREEQGATADDVSTNSTRPQLGGGAGNSEVPPGQEVASQKTGGSSTQDSLRPPTPAELRYAYDIILRSQSVTTPPAALPSQVGRTSGSTQQKAVVPGASPQQEALHREPPFPNAWDAQWSQGFEYHLSDYEEGQALKPAKPPLLDLTIPTDTEAAITGMCSELQGLLEEYKVEREIMAALATFGYTDILVFSKAGRDEAAFERFIQKNLQLDVDKSMLHSSAAARLTLAWEAAVERKDVQKKEDAEARVGGLNKVLTKVKHSSMRRAYDAAHSELEPP